MGAFSHPSHAIMFVLLFPVTWPGVHEMPAICYTYVLYFWKLETAHLFVLHKMCPFESHRVEHKPPNSHSCSHFWLTRTISSVFVLVGYGNVAQVFLLAHLSQISSNLFDESSHEPHSLSQNSTLLFFFCFIILLWFAFCRDVQDRKSVV